MFIMLITRHSHHHEGVINPEPICIKPDRDLLRNSLTIKSSLDTTVPTGSLYYDYERLLKILSCGVSVQKG